MTRRGSPEPDPESPPEGEAISPCPSADGVTSTSSACRPAAHVLAVECPAASAVRELRVQADRETRIDPPLLLEELTLDIVVTPTVDPDGRPWQLTVDATAPRWRRIADKAPASADGRWARRGLTAGSYRVAVKSADGTPWLQRFFELGADSGPLSLRLGFVAVAGRVLLGTQPLRARLVFFNEAGGEPVTLTSDDDGRFQGLLPGRARRPGDPLDRRGARGATADHRRLEGVSVPSAGRRGERLAGAGAADGRGARNRGVRGGRTPERRPGHLRRHERGARTVAATDDAGSFELPELPPGSYTAVAESAEGVSERTAARGGGGCRERADSWS